MVLPLFVELITIPNILIKLSVEWIRSHGSYSVYQLIHN
jgi:hypothetical protein